MGVVCERKREADEKSRDSVMSEEFLVDIILVAWTKAVDEIHDRGEF